MKDFIPGRPTRIALHEPPAHAPNAALLIDFDNVTMGIRSDLQNQLRRLLNSEIIKGKVAVQRAYADWRRYPQYIVPLSEASIDLIFAPAFGSNKKNATDIRLAIDALELVFTRPEIGTFILLSGDSDFSSLVLKLKEYGKYIIGVGIRESSSDLLIQNCDEYYSYTEVTGLTKEGDLEGARRNPWELVVEAISQMKREGDVMRSDRLKQVMQTIDSNFDEKDAGFSRFSKFVVEAGRRGLLSLEKMENGQYAVDVGADANVPPEEEAELRRATPAQESPAKPRRKQRPRRREPETERGLTLAAAFDLLRRVLAGFEEVRGPGAAAEDVYARVLEMHGDPDEPMFERPRFQRLLRQAHDAQIVELAKVDDTYRLKLGPDADIPKPEEPEPASTPRGTGGRETKAEAEAAPEAAGDRPADRGTGEGRKPGRSRSRSSRKRAAPKDEERSEQPRTAERAAPPAPPREGERAPDAHAAAAKTDGAPPKRNPRFRRGSRGTPTARPASGAAEKETPRKEAASGEAAPTPAPGGKQPESSPDGESHPSRTVRGRRGGRGRGRGGRPERTAEEKAAAPTSPPVDTTPRTRTPPAEPRAAEPAEPRAREAPPVTPAPAAPQQGSLFEGAPADEGSLFRRMTAALQRVMRGQETEE